jgi:hypothetical protein
MRKAVVTLIVEFEDDAWFLEDGHLTTEGFWSGLETDCISVEDENIMEIEENEKRD